MRRILAGVVLAVMLTGAAAAIAAARSHPRMATIVALNLLLGWTVIGWIAALVWTCIAKRPSVGSSRQS